MVIAEFPLQSRALTVRFVISGLNTDEFSEAYENLNTVDNEIADESNLIFEFLIGNENYMDWQ